MKVHLICQPYPTKFWSGCRKVDKPIQNRCGPKNQTWKDKTMPATLQNQLEIRISKKTSTQRKILELENDSAKTQNPKSNNGKSATSKRETPNLYKKAVRPTARVSGLVGEPTHETEKMLSLGLLNLARPTTKSACTHCWAASLTSSQFMVSWLINTWHSSCHHQKKHQNTNESDKR